MTTTETTAKMMTDKIRRRAFEIYEEGGRVPGGEEEDWFQAEREIAQELSEQRAQNHQNKDAAMQEAFDLDGIDGRELTGHLPAQPGRRSQRI